jgi:hypothetical protein
MSVNEHGEPILTWASALEKASALHIEYRIAVCVVDDGKEFLPSEGKLYCTLLNG